MNASIRYQFNYWAIAIVATAIALTLTLLLKSLLTPTLGSFFLIAIVISTWYGGIKPGLLATGISTLAINYFFVSPLHAFTIASFSDIVRLGVFVLVALIINFFNSSLPRSKQRVEQLRQQLQDRERQLRLILTAARIGTWDVNILTAEVKWSAEHEDLFGLAPGTFDGKLETLFTYVHPEDREALNCAVERVIQTGKLYQHDYRIIQPNGSVRWIENRGQVFYDRAGQAVRMVGTVIDITRRKRAEAALKHSERRLQAIFDTEPECVTIITTDGILLDKNPAGLATIEADSLEQVLGQYMCSIVVPEHRQAFIKFLQRTTQEKSGILEFEIIGLKGTRRWLESHAVILQEGSESPTKILAVTRDITECKRVEQALKQANEKLELRVAERTAKLTQINHQLKNEIVERQQIEATLRAAERRWRSLLEDVQLIVVGLDRMGNVEYINPFFLEVTGYTQEEVLGKNWFKNFLPHSQQQQVNSAFDEILEKNFHSYYQNQIITKSGQELYIAWNNTILQDGQGHIIGTLSIGEDITHRQAVERMKNEFISIVSHELRTPLTSIRGSLGLLATGIYDNKPEKARRMLEIAITDSDRLVRLVNDILDLERLDSGKVTLEKKLCNAADLMQQAAQTVQAIADGAAITLSVSPESAPVWADFDSIIQTLTNLLSNAIKFSPGGSTIWVTAQASNPYVLFTVKDSGRGIPIDKLEAIFGRFQQVDATDSRQKGGTGLGLTICRSIVQQHGGHIWAESILNRGSTFYFTLPVQAEL